MDARRAVTRRAFLRSGVGGTAVVAFGLLAQGCAAPAPAGSGAPATAVSASPSAAIEARLGHVFPADHAINLGAERFAELVARKTSNTVKIQVFHSSQLGADKDAMEGATLGSIQFPLTGSAVPTTFAPRIGVFLLPFLFRDQQHAWKVVDGPIGQEVAQGLLDKGIRPLAYWENGFRNITNSRRPITRPEDLQGLKLRVPESKVYVETFKALGANPTPMAFNQLYSALQQGVVDGQENPIPLIFTSKFYEVQKYLSLSEHVWDPCILSVSEAFWKKLSTDQQNAIQAAAIEARDEQRQILNKQVGEMLTEIKTRGVQVNEVDRKAFQAAVRGVITRFETEFGKDLIQRIVDTQ